MTSNETVVEIVQEMREMPQEWIVDANANFVFTRYADRIKAANKREIAAKDAEIAELRRRLKVAADALEAASDAFRFSIEHCELELGPRMIGKLCDDGKAVERALAAIREPVTDCNRLDSKGRCDCVVWDDEDRFSNNRLHR